jgi:hypothetical protein
MLNRPQLRGITLSPGLDRRKLSLNGFVAYGSSQWSATSLNPLFRKPYFLIGEQRKWPEGPLIVRQNPPFLRYRTTVRILPAGPNPGGATTDTDIR